jgi:hypothetical protein
MEIGAVPCLHIASVGEVTSTPTGARLVITHLREDPVVEGASPFFGDLLAGGDFLCDFGGSTGHRNELIRLETSLQKCLARSLRVLHPRDELLARNLAGVGETETPSVRAGEFRSGEFHKEDLVPILRLLGDLVGDGSFDLEFGDCLITIGRGKWEPHTNRLRVLRDFVDDAAVGEREVSGRWDIRRLSEGNHTANNEPKCQSHHTGDGGVSPFHIILPVRGPAKRPATRRLQVRGRKR